MFIMRSFVITVACLMSATAYATTNFIATSFYAASTPFSKEGYTEWADTVRELSNGELDPKVYTGTVLLSPRGALQGVQDNVAQVASITAVYAPSEMPVANAVQALGFNYSDPLVAALAVTDFSIHNDRQLQEWKGLNIVYLGSYSTPPYLLFCREPVRNLEEIKGKRIRTAGSTVSQWVEQVGGIPVNVPSSETYSGLDRGTLDCGTNAGNDLIDRSYWEVAPYTTLLPTGMYWAGPHWGFNAEFWFSLSDNQRKTLMRATASALVEMTLAFIDRSEWALQEGEAKGNTIYEPQDDLMKAVKDYRATMSEKIYDVAEETYGVEGPEKMVNEFRETFEKWKELIAQIDRSDADALKELVWKEIYTKVDLETYGMY